MCSADSLAVLIENSEIHLSNMSMQTDIQYTKRINNFRSIFPQSIGHCILWTTQMSIVLAWPCLMYIIILNTAYDCCRYVPLKFGQWHSSKTYINISACACWGPNWKYNQHKWKMCPGSKHSSIHIHFRLRCCPCPMRLAVPSYVEHQLSMHLCLMGQRQLGHTYRHQSSHIQTMSSEAKSFLSSAGKCKVCDRFDTRLGLLYTALLFPVPSETLTAKDRCNVLHAKFLYLVKLRVFRLCLWCCRSNRSWHGHCGGAAAVCDPLVPTFCYHGAWPHKRRPHTPCYISWVRGVWWLGQARVFWTFPKPHSI